MSCCCICNLLCLAIFAVSTGYCLYQASYCQKQSAEVLKRWLYVWTFIGALALVEKILFFLPLIPGYCILKSLFIVWLYHEKYNGAQFLYHTFIQPFDAHLDILLKPLAFLNLEKSQ
ncbi:hypothetical protein ABPG74_009536 [Tetrahymena malaccensis]